jgi:ubiquinone/menaquinone biosynthesis C-methylase UbiE
VLADFRALPFPDESFYHIVFDPPHLKDIGDTAWMAKKYGKLPKDWQSLIRDGFHECWRVLKTNGTLIFKWNETQIPTSKVIEAIGVEPLYGHKSGKLSKTHWMAFVKLPKM